MKKYYHIVKVDYLPARYVGVYYHTATETHLSVHPDAVWQSLPNLRYDLRMEVSDTVDEEGRIYKCTLSATVQDDFSPEAMKRENIIVRVTDSLGKEYIIGSPAYRGVTTSVFSTDIAAGTLGKKVEFTSTSDREPTQVVYDEWREVEGLSVTPSVLELGEGEGAAVSFVVLPSDDLKKK